MKIDVTKLTELIGTDSFVAYSEQRYAEGLAWQIFDLVQPESFEVKHEYVEADDSPGFFIVEVEMDKMKVKITYDYLGRLTHKDLYIFIDDEPQFKLNHVAIEVI